MKPIDNPYLPKNKVGVFIADTHIENAVVIKPPSVNILPESMRRHADLGIVIVSCKKAVCPPETCAYYRKALSPYGFEIFQGKSHLGSNYPQDSAYNVGIVGNKCFLNKNVCDDYLYEILIREDYEIINVRQGYTKCSICPIDENSFITGDISIAKKGIDSGLDVLLISNEGITLPGFSNGFWGGTCGLGAGDELLINGDIDTFPDADKVISFLKKKNILISSQK